MHGSSRGRGDPLPGIKKLPDIFSLVNGALGVFAIMYAIDGAFAISGGLILLAIVMDGLDGAAARRLDAVSNVGKELDSIADMVSFAMAPAVLIYSWHYDQSAGSSLLILSGYTAERAVNLLAVLASATGMLLGMYRLMRYRSSDFELPHFLGLPTPAYAFTIVVSIHLLPPLAFLSFASLIGLLMVARIGYPRVQGPLVAPALTGLALAMAGTALPGARTLLLAPAMGLIILYMISPLIMGRRGKPSKKRT
jgi:CDP-diacylglycerol--serine O-phosphatidyltransferase